MRLLETATTRAALPWLIGGALLIGAAGGGWLGWTLQGGRVARAEAKVVAMQARLDAASTQAKADATEARLKIEALSTDLAHSWKLRQVERVEVIREIERVSSRDRRCLSAGTRGVLQRASGAAAAEGEGAGKPSGAAAGPAADPGGHAGASEQAVALWMNAAQRQYQDLKHHFITVSDAMRALPCVEVVP